MNEKGFAIQCTGTVLENNIYFYNNIYCSCLRRRHKKWTKEHRFPLVQNVGMHTICKLVFMVQYKQKTRLIKPRIQSPFTIWQMNELVRLENFFLQISWTFRECWQFLCLISSTSVFIHLDVLKILHMIPSWTGADEITAISTTMKKWNSSETLMHSAYGVPHKKELTGRLLHLS